MMSPNPYFVCINISVGVCTFQIPNKLKISNYIASRMKGMRNTRTSLDADIEAYGFQDRRRFHGRSRNRRFQQRQGITINKNSLSGAIDAYQRLDIIGSGAYGEVYRAMDKKTGEIVAIKKERYGLSKKTLNEIDILESLRGHPRFVQLKSVLKDVPRNNVFLVMEFLETDLENYMDGATLDIHQVKEILKQLLEGVKYLHDNGVMHRDLKPSNILLSNECNLKICDFGLSRRFGIGSNGNEVYTPNMVTIYYRAPELLFGMSDYSCAVDMWSVGCIMGELLTKKVLFDGLSELEQLRKIFGILGMPGNGYIPDMYVTQFAEQPHNTLQDKISNEGAIILSDSGFDLLNRFLAYEAAERMTATEALNHSWFKEDI